MTTPTMVRIAFRIDAAEGGGIVGETLWAERVGVDRFRLANTPFYVRGVSYRDVVFGRRGRSGVLAFNGVSLRGGHSTLWMALRVDPSAEAFRSRWAELHEIGCGYESSGRFLAVDVPPATDFRTVEERCEAGAAAGVWDYEVAHCGHPAGGREP